MKISRTKREIALSTKRMSVGLPPRNLAASERPGIGGLGDASRDFSREPISRRPGFPGRTFCGPSDLRWDQNPQTWLNE